MAASVQDMTVAQDLEEEPRVMDGYRLLRESYVSETLATRLIRTILPSGGTDEEWTEDI